MFHDGRIAQVMFREERERREGVGAEGQAVGEGSGTYRSIWEWLTRCAGAHRTHERLRVTHQHSAGAVVVRCGMLDSVLQEA